jgi:hypothetical protein
MLGASKEVPTLEVSSSSKRWLIEWSFPRGAFELSLKCGSLYNFTNCFSAFLVHHIPERKSICECMYNFTN